MMQYNLWKLFFVSVVVSMCLISAARSHETDMTKELLLTYEEKAAFDKFKSQVYQNVSQSVAFIKTDLFLLRWIRAKKLDVNRAVRDMFEFLEWRRKNKMDTIQEEDWSDMRVDHPYRLDVVDRQGRPVAVGSIGGTWNIRRSALQGKLPRLTRYVYKILDEVYRRTYDINVNSTHQNITQFSVIGSLEGFNPFTSACGMCLTVYIQLLSVYTRFYPNFVHTVIAINTPATFTVILDMIRPMLPKETNDLLKIYGHNKNQWKPVLDQEVDESQLTAEFGGTRPDDDDYME